MWLKGVKTAGLAKEENDWVFLRRKYVQEFWGCPNHSNFPQNVLERILIFRLVTFVKNFSVQFKFCVLSFNLLTTSRMTSFYCFCEHMNTKKNSLSFICHCQYSLVTLKWIKIFDLQHIYKIIEYFSDLWHLVSKKCFDRTVWIYPLSAAKILIKKSISSFKETSPSKMFGKSNTIL